MGIKFRCPNGHKLNVKSFLAGKRGICPHCGAKVQIPGDPEQAAEEASGMGGVALATAVVGAPAAVLADTVTLPNTFSQPTVPTGAALVTASAPAPISVATVSPTPAPVAAVAINPVIPMGAAIPAPMVANAAPVMPTVAAPLAPSPYAVMPAAPVDPIVEAPNAVWYVRPPSGGQFGPARGDIMRKWLGEGRVSSDSLVWRDGWTDWKSAAAVFPSLGGAPVPAPSAPLLSGAVVPATASASKNAAARSVRAKKRGNSFAVGMVIGLGLLAVLLLVVFIAVLSGALGS
jgi:hypothetical protein